MKQDSGLDIQGISAPPALFCTIHGEWQKNNASLEVVQTLAAHLVHEEVSCHVFADAPEYFAACDGIPPERIVVLFDQMGMRRCFRPLFRGASGRLFPVWSAQAWWGVMINPNLCAQKRLHSAVRQVAADFYGNFLKNIQKGWYPFGLPASKESTARRQEKKAGKEKRRSLNRASSLWGTHDQSFL